MILADGLRNELLDFGLPINRDPSRMINKSPGTEAAKVDEVRDSM
jgi:hypothetical protein